MSVSGSDPLLDLVAVAYEAPVETAPFLASVEACLDVAFRLTVVDNASPDPRVRAVIDAQTRRVAQSPHCRAVLVVHAPENGGYARACNQGAALGPAPYLALVNCDTQFLPGVASDVLAAFDADPRIGVVGPRHTTSGGLLTHSGIVTGPDGRDRDRFWMQPDVLVGERCRDTIDVPTVSRKLPQS